VIGVGNDWSYRSVFTAGLRSHKSGENLIQAWTLQSFLRGRPRLAVLTLE
jgi:hypothetical protein